MISLIIIFGLAALLLILFLIIKRGKRGSDFSGSTPLDSGFQSGTAETNNNNFDGFGGGEFGGGGAEGSWSDRSDSGGSDSGGGGDGGGGD